MIKFSSYHSTYDKREIIIFLAMKFSKNTLLLEMSFIILVVKKEETEFKTYFYDKNKSLIQISYRDFVFYIYIFISYCRHYTASMELS